MESKALKVGWIVTLIMGIYIVVLGLAWTFATEAMSEPVFASFTGQSWSDFVTDSPKQAELFTMTARLAGVMSVVTGLIVAMIAGNAYRKAERWSWYTALFAGILGWGSTLAFQIAVGSSVGIAMVTIGWVILVIGLTVPAKAILSGKAKGKEQTKT